jgi:hypothetical protein
MTAGGGARRHCRPVNKAGARYVKNHRLNTKTQPLAPNYTPVGEVLFTFAHHFGKYFRYLGLRDVKMESDEARRESRRQSNQLESIIAVNASHSKRGVA